MRDLSYWVLVTVVLAVASGSLASPPLALPVIHEPWLNWDFVVPAGLGPINDLHVVVANPDFKPGETADDPLLPTWGYDGVQNQVPYGPGSASVLSWSNGGFASPTLPAGTVVHFGADMRGAGTILDAYWTMDGHPVPGGRIPIIWEVTRVWPWPDPDPLAGRIEMGLQTTQTFLDENPGSTVELDNIQTWYDIPAADLGLQDINRELDLFSVTGNDGNFGSDFEVESFFDVFYVGDSQNTGPDYESLLVADIVVIDPTGGATTVGTFWNLNPQCPEPGTMALLAVGAAALLRRRRR